MTSEILPILAQMKEDIEQLVYRWRENYEQIYLTISVQRLLDHYTMFQRYLAESGDRTLCATNMSLHNFLEALFIQVYNTQVYFKRYKNPFAAEIAATLQTVQEGVREASLLSVNLPAPPSPVQLNPDEILQ